MNKPGEPHIALVGAWGEGDDAPMYVHRCDSCYHYFEFLRSKGCLSVCDGCCKMMDQFNEAFRDAREEQEGAT